MSNVIQFKPKNEILIDRATKALIDDLRQRGYPNPEYSGQVSQMRQSMTMAMIVNAGLTNGTNT